jgi:pimeloyl-ACP methyl ester carboxylesterase
VLEAGGGAYAIDWALVQPRIAETTRICSYDRAGLGWSDPGPADETVEQTVADLHKLLAVAGEKGPYLLVGASVGGAFLRAYQRSFPGGVAALVFTNSSNRIGFKAGDKADLIWRLSAEDIRSSFPRPVSKSTEPSHEGAPFDRLPPELQETRLWLDQRLWERENQVPPTPDAILSWRMEFLREFDEAAKSLSPPLGRLPVIVVASAKVADRSDCSQRNTAASCLDFLSANTVHITAEGSGHEIHLFQPETLVKALLQAIAAVRNKMPLM